MPPVTGHFVSMLYQRPLTAHRHSWAPPCLPHIIRWSHVTPALQHLSSTCVNKAHSSVVGTLPKPCFWGPGHDLIYVRKTLTFSASRSACSCSFVPSTMAWETQRAWVVRGPGDKQCFCAECAQEAPALPAAPSRLQSLEGQPPGLCSSSHVASGGGAWNQEASQSTSPCAKPGSMCAVGWLEQPLCPPSPS